MIPMFERNSILDELTDAIVNDILTANRELDSDQCRQYLSDPFFQKSN